MNIELLLNHYWHPAVAFWKSGGWGMWALAFNGVVMFALAFGTLLKLMIRGVFADPERAWLRWQNDPSQPRGPIGRILQAAASHTDPDAVTRYFAALRSDEVNPFEGDLRAMKVSVSTAPLLGLLGTVTGMLTTFHALARGGGGEKTMGMIASGISEALITTEAGLVLALTGMIFLFGLNRAHSGYLKLLLHIEVLCTQDRQGATRAPSRPLRASRPVMIPA